MKKYWKSIEETNPDYIPVPDEKFEQEEKSAILDMLQDKVTGAKASRRDFLKLCGYSFTLASVAASCERPIEKAIPYLIKPEEVTPGVASYYASSFFDGEEFAGIIVKVRDGRPIKIEGNKLCPVGQSGTTAKVQASVLNLYDQANYTHPFIKGEKSEWEKTDAEITQQLKEIVAKKGNITLLTSTIISPSLREAFKEFLKAHPGSSWVQYDSISFSGMLEANQKTFGQPMIPMYRFDNADLIVSFGADFLGTWLMPAEFARQYSTTRSLTGGRKRLSRLIQFETGLSITGSSADHRISMKPSQELILLGNIYKGVATATGFKSLEVPETTFDIDTIVEQLLEAKGRALIVSGNNDVNIQMLVNAINQMLGSYGATIDLSQQVLLKQGNDQQFNELLEKIQSGQTDALIVYNANPVFDHPSGKKVREAIEKVPLVISLSNAPDETSELANYICPDHHFLASWGDSEPVKGLFTLAQPLIRPLGDTRQICETLLKWSGKEQMPLDFLKEDWKKNHFSSSGNLVFIDFWNDCLQKGVLDKRETQKASVAFNHDALRSVTFHGSTSGNEFELLVYSSIALGSGKYANNPWLQELPDPVSKISWDNYVSISQSDATELDVETGNILKLNNELELPAYIQPGQTPGTVSVAMGYGRKAGGKVAKSVGKNIMPLVPGEGHTRLYHGIVELEKIAGSYELALSQTHHHMEGRDIVRETNLNQYLEDPASGNEMHKKHQKHMVTLYEKVEFDGIHWGMAIDLNKCNGCSSCVIGCQAENNIPVIGKKEVVNRRIMHWIRIDRYFSGDPVNPKVHFQPVMCQHCDNAPCENVCPVAATNHSNEGINQMAYIRCIGTKYCINNCPYKVRRFNWFAYVNNQNFDYHINNDLGKMVLNPDVTVRERGVVEKCSFCIQRIQEAKLKAKLENRILAHGDVMPACAQACPSGAIIFGDLNDENSEISKLYKDPRNYYLLEELHTLPTVGYLTRVRNEKV
jgi:MoCo/4Fe-4S cofactor protein with predicted Tat translocation signal